MNPGAKLRLVPFSSDDHSLGSQLNKTDGEQVEHPDEMAAIFSLYFQWPEHRVAFIAKNSGAQDHIECELNYDRDERTPSEIWVKITDKKKTPEFVEFESLTVKFIVFHTCYEFKVPALAVDANAENGWHVIFASPSSITIRKNRRLPRYQIPENIPIHAHFYKNGDATAVQLDFIEIGLQSVRVHAKNSTLEGVGRLKGRGFDVAAQVVRKLDNHVILSLSFDSGIEFGQYFDFYKTIAYPSLRSRYDFPLEVGIQLYKDSNYFGKYEGEKSVEQIGNLIDTWEKTRTGFHSTNADYYVIDDQGKPTGTSGLALSHFKEKIQVWVGHQLCALKRPDFFEESGNLYQWRAEYLSGLPGQLIYTVWFHSKSRWHERIYAKHAMYSKLGSKVIPVVDRRVIFERAEDNPKVRLKTFKVGELNRVATLDEKICGGIGPRCLNANENLDTIIATSDSTLPEEVKDLGRQLVRESKQEKASILVTVGPSFDIDSLGGTPQLSDRMTEIPKEDLINFMASLEHTIAISSRKHENGKSA